MKFVFKEQGYQIAAVKAVTDVFKGQAYHAMSRYTHDAGKLTGKTVQGRLFTTVGDQGDVVYDDDNDPTVGFANHVIELADADVLNNIRAVQLRENLNLDDNLAKALSPLDLDVEMETGTGKTYVYIRTILELNKLYGFSKFIIVVPSVAIREGVKKSFEQTRDHFMSIYRKKIRYFIYDSKNLSQIDSFAKDSAIEAMIINIQAFNARGADARRIKMPLDEFGSRRPIDVIAKTKPILILDEPQKMGGDATKEAIGDFNPLFTLSYSATHKEHHNLVYVLGALDAYNKKLVKKIEVKSVTVNKQGGTQPFVYLDEIVLCPGKDPLARISFFRREAQGVKPVTKLLRRGDSIYDLSNKMSAYQNRYVIDEIDYGTDVGYVKLLNGIVIHAGEVIGDSSEDVVRRIQIRETISSHLQKEQENFHKGIKTLSLFFLDEVKKYRDYDRPDGKGPYARIFEEEYQAAVNEFLNDLTNNDEKYKGYLESFAADEVHKGYFSVDKKGRAIDSKRDRKTGLSDDESAYDLILRDKERLLSFDEPTRFIFSHSALREGWDNPNVFQICTLRHTHSDIQKRQEVGRGLRIAVDKDGNRQDAATVNDFFGVNTLTVIANEEYEEFVKSLQNEIKEVLYNRPSKLDAAFFIGKTVADAAGAKHQITDPEGRTIHNHLVRQGYVDDEDNLTEKWASDVANGTFAEMPEQVRPYQDSIIALLKRGGTIEIANGKRPRVTENRLNRNFARPDFQTLWSEINHKYSYRVTFDSKQLVENCIESINKELSVSKITYSVDVGVQKDQITRDEVDSSFERTVSGSKKKPLSVPISAGIKYDLVHEIAQRTYLTRKTVVAILLGTRGKLSLFRDNPEEYIANISNLINAQKAEVIVSHISYHQIDGEFDSEIFNERHANADPSKILASKKSVQDYVFVDGTAKDGESNEMAFAESLEAHEEVQVYAKLPKGYFIPTPMGKYSPDWAIVYRKDNGDSDIYFIAETKGSLSSLQLRKIEDSKMKCAEVVFGMPGSRIHYNKAHTYQDLLNFLEGTCSQKHEAQSADGKSNKGTNQR
jgi:type III restriction enzyme